MYKMCLDYSIDIFTVSLQYNNYKCFEKLCTNCAWIIESSFLKVSLFPEVFPTTIVRGSESEKWELWRRAVGTSLRWCLSKTAWKASLVLLAERGCGRKEGQKIIKGVSRTVLALSGGRLMCRGGLRRRGLGYPLLTSPRTASLSFAVLKARLWDLCCQKLSPSRVSAGKMLWSGMCSS